MYIYKRRRRQLLEEYPEIFRKESPPLSPPPPTTPGTPVSSIPSFSSNGSQYQYQVIFHQMDHVIQYLHLDFVRDVLQLHQDY